MCAIASVLAPYYLARADSALFARPTHIFDATTDVLIAAYYAVISIAYIRREDARATAAHWLPRVAAIVATWLPLTMPFLGRPGRVPAVAVVGNALLLAGLCWSIWSLCSLGRNLSIVPQVRSLVTAGPYKLVRHPLYLGELVMLLGVCMGQVVGITQLYWVVILGLQLYRIHHEELLLQAAIPKYQRYKGTTKRLVPGLY
jgi:protein-S-isoprenylcysteine O-methyltransferase Ste14